MWVANGIRSIGCPGASLKGIEFSRLRIGSLDVFARAQSLVFDIAKLGIGVGARDLDGAEIENKL